MTTEDRPSAGGSGLLLVKLGGSLVTDKRSPRTLRGDVLERVASEVAAAIERGAGPLLLGHGSGSFGHDAAERYGVPEGIRSAEDLPGVVATQAAASELHAHVLSALRGAGIAAFSVAPSSSMVTIDGEPLLAAVEPVRLALVHGLTPVTYGDVVLDRRRGAAICSTETALLTYARGLLGAGHELRGACWFGDTDGVLDQAGATIERIDGHGVSAVLADVGGAAATDVTGGMRHRLETAAALARLGVPSWILDGRPPGAVQAALLGEPRGGTLVAP